ncbi:MAG: Cytochrome c [Deltaproteobacteria bacterium]|nr:Cytochrome c [Deltaproteobacteria bacterium]
MALETTLRRFLFPPPSIQTGKDKPRKPHWLGDKVLTPAQQGQSPGGKKEDSPKPGRDMRGYRDLASLTLGDVHDAYDFFKSQLLPSPYEAWVNTNYFCMLELVRRRDGRPPVFFGRVKICYPSDGYIHNIQDMELYFPNKNRKPDTVLLRAEDILLDPGKPVQSYCARVKFFALSLAVILAATGLHAADPFAENVRTTDPLTPEQQQKTFHLPPGFDIQLVAAEPDLRKPMNMAFDALGRLWITESR